MGLVLAVSKLLTNRAGRQGSRGESWPPVGHGDSGNHSSHLLSSSEVPGTEDFMSLSHVTSPAQLSEREEIWDKGC